MDNCQCVTERIRESSRCPLNGRQSYRANRQATISTEFCLAKSSSCLGISTEQRIAIQLGMLRTFSIVVVLALCVGCDPNAFAPKSSDTRASSTATPLPFEELSGRVQRVMDGDSVKFQLDGGEIIEVRLDGIDAPEKDQPFGDEARTVLHNLTNDRVVYLISTGTDKYGRTLGKLHDGNVFINGELIRLGMAWHYARFNDDQRLADLQSAAMQNGVGLWGQRAQPVPPWEFRSQ